ncbi:MAG: hypothetical protein GYB67_11600 [Chloroflexi bacterium]|nr:hypothetical protein [Chloroflexota bacterium]
MLVDDSSIHPYRVVENFRRVYLGVMGREPMIRYMGDEWYHVNGTSVDHRTLLAEIERLEAQAKRAGQPRRPQTSAPHTGVIKRIIKALRGA